MWIDDQILEEASKELAIQIFTPPSTMVVLGRSNEADLEVNTENCKLDGVPILKRLGGGGTVVLYPGCVVISLGCWVAKDFHNKSYFEKINQSVIDCIPLGLNQRGISDICCDDKKVGGTSLFRSGRYLLYQLSLICEPRLDLIERYLKHPSQEPDYRAQRKHSEFLSSLMQLDPQWIASHTVQVLQSSFESQLRSVLGQEFRTPNTKERERAMARLEISDYSY
jgi:lipoate---protein ligase